MKVYANGIPPVVHVVRVSSLGVFLLRLWFIYEAAAWNLVQGGY